VGRKRKTEKNNPIRAKRGYKGSYASQTPSQPHIFWAATPTLFGHIEGARGSRNIVEAVNIARRRVFYCF
jgi:hypothetical protein